MMLRVYEGLLDRASIPQIEGPNPVGRANYLIDYNRIVNLIDVELLSCHVNCSFKPLAKTLKTHHILAQPGQIEGVLCQPETPHRQYPNEG